jgi:hypothetical protein
MAVELMKRFGEDEKRTGPSLGCFLRRKTNPVASAIFMMHIRLIPPKRKNL